WFASAGISQLTQTLASTTTGAGGAGICLAPYVVYHVLCRHALGPLRRDFISQLVKGGPCAVTVAVRRTIVGHRHYARYNPAVSCYLYGLAFVMHFVYYRAYVRLQI